MIGNKIMLATVWETKVATSAKKNRIIHIDNHGEPAGSTTVTSPVMYVSNPELLTAHPRTLPPPMSTTVCQESELKSNSVSKPHPNMNTAYSSAMIPGSPNTFSVK